MPQIKYTKLGINTDLRKRKKKREIVKIYLKYNSNSNEQLKIDHFVVRVMRPILHSLYVTQFTTDLCKQLFTQSCHFLQSCLINLRFNYFKNCKIIFSAYNVACFRSKCERILHIHTYEK